MDIEVRVRLSEDGADALRLAELSGYLREELLLLDVVNVELLRGEQPPTGARAIDGHDIGGLLVVLGQSAEAIGAVVSVIRGWLRRGHDTSRMVRIDVGGDVIELSNATAEQQETLINLFVGRHEPGPAGDG